MKKTIASAGTVIECVNEAAKELLAGTDFVSADKPYDAVLKDILVRLYESEYLKPDTMIRTEILGVSDQNGVDELTMTTQSILDQFVQEKQLKLDHSNGGGLGADGMFPENPDHRPEGSDGDGNEGEQSSQESGDQGNTGDDNTPVQGTIQGSVTVDGDYTVVVLGQDNWMDYFEEYTDILFLADENGVTNRLILRKYFILKPGGSDTRFPNPTIIGLKWVVGTIYLKK